MKKIIFLTGYFFLLFTNSVFSQTTEQLKVNAVEKFQQEDYSSAVKLLEEALENDTTDKEIYYYLGHFSHYRAYDSRSVDYDQNYYNQIFHYLDKALELDANYGDALYFYVTQCGANAVYCLQNKDTIAARSYYLKAYDKKCFPPWLLEYGMNVLNQCEENAILFCNGDAELNTLTYLQLVKNVRQDVTIIPIGLLDRIWYVLLLKNGLGNFVKKTNINLPENQIFDLHLFKWKENKIEISINSELKKTYSLNDNFNIEVLPDVQLIDNKDRTYLSVDFSVLLNIVEANINERPVFFTNFDILADYLQRYGLIFKLMPFKTKDTLFETNFNAIEKLLKKENFTNYKTITTTDQPYISSILFKYHSYCWLPLIQHYIDTDNKKKADFLLDFMNNNLMAGGDFDTPIKEWLKKLDFYKQSNRK